MYVFNEIMLFIGLPLSFLLLIIPLCLIILLLFNKWFYEAIVIFLAHIIGIVSLVLDQGLFPTLFIIICWSYIIVVLIFRKRLKNFRKRIISSSILTFVFLTIIGLLQIPMFYKLTDDKTTIISESKLLEDIRHIDRRQVRTNSVELDGYKTSKILNLAIQNSRFLDDGSPTLKKYEIYHTMNIWLYLQQISSSVSINKIICRYTDYLPSPSPRHIEITKEQFDRVFDALSNSNVPINTENLSKKWQELN